MTSPLDHGSGLEARRIRIRGVVQGVGFRPFVYRLALDHALFGWVLNGRDGVEIHAEGEPSALGRFLTRLQENPPPAAHVLDVDTRPVPVEGHGEFVIRLSRDDGRPTVRISPDLALCDECRTELFDPSDRRFHYPYINCTDCGPRYSIILGLPYDRPRTTMAGWALCEDCEREYHDPLNRRFHAQPVACPVCGPHLLLEEAGAASPAGAAGSGAALAGAAELLASGKIVAVKGLGGYHLACDARNQAAVEALRQAKFRKEKPFALMVRDVETARGLADFSAAALQLLRSMSRPVVLAPARVELPGVAPGNLDLGVMLPYTPVHELLFHHGAPDVLVLTSGNRSSEPIAYRDDQARARLTGLADAFLVGERPIARRVDDSVVRVDRTGPVILRRARGYAPGAVGRLPPGPPTLAVGADLKNTITLVVDGEAFQSQHLGDLEHMEAFAAFTETVDDLTAMYGLKPADLEVVHDLHPQYASTRFALEGGFRATRPVQHHRAHVASVIAEREEWSARVLGVAFDGTGYGDDGGVWGGELFVGGLEEGLRRVAHLRPAPLPGGDAAARHPVQAAAGFLSQLDGPLPDLEAAPFSLPSRFREAQQLIARDVRVFQTTSAGRLFDTVAALCGFRRAMSFEGQAAIWLEHLARTSPGAAPYPLPHADGELDWRPALERAVQERAGGVDAAEVASGFHRGLAAGLTLMVEALCEAHEVDTVALSGGVFQNLLLLEDATQRLKTAGLRVWTNRRVPPNDGGISLGQAALALGRPSQ